MLLRCLGLFLLVWFPGVLHAQSEALPCSAPVLAGGYFVPKHKTYPDGTTLTYTCNDGLKPAAEGWWATSTCRNGKWSDEPQCINEKACIKPTIPNGKPTADSNSWFVEGSRVSVICDSGYDLKPLEASEAVCTNGMWSVPVCEKSLSSCDEPPYIPNALVLHKYQEVFAENSYLQYQCKGRDQIRHITCRSGSWTKATKCPSDCYLNTDEHPKLKPVGVKVIKNGDSLTPECITKTWRLDEFSVVQCIEGELKLSKCCYSATIAVGGCTRPMVEADDA